MSDATHQAFKDIVLRGLYLPNGMPRWDDLLNERDAEDIHAFLIDEQAKAHVREMALAKQGQPIDAPVATVMSNY